MNLELIRGDDIDIEVELVNHDTGGPIDITGCTIFFTVKRVGDDDVDDVDDVDAVIEKDITSHTDAVGGKSIISLTHTDTNIPVGYYYYDIQIKDGNGKLQSTERSKMTIIQDISRRIT